jgi:hypothetical protein
MDASFLKDILRPAPTAAEGIPANVAHPFQVQHLFACVQGDGVLYS